MIIRSFETTMFSSSFIISIKHLITWELWGKGLSSVYASNLCVYQMPLAKGIGS